MDNLIAPIREPAVDAYPSLLTVAARSDALRAWLDSGDRGSGVASRDEGCLRVQPWAIGCEGPVTCFPDGTEVGPVEIGDATWDPDGDPDEAPTAVTRVEVAAPQLPTLGRFRPWTFHLRVGGGYPDIFEPWADYAARAAERDLAREVSREVWVGRYSGGHSLLRDAVDITPAGGAVNLAHAFGVLADAVDTHGTFHVPRLAASELQERGLLRWVSGALPVTAEGWPVSLGPGYTRATPVPSPWRPNVADPASLVTTPAAALAADEAYIVGHPGLVEWAVRELPNERYGAHPADDRDALTNRRDGMARREAIVRYATCNVFAVRVTLAVR